MKRLIFSLYHMMTRIPVVGRLSVFALNLYRQLMGKPRLIYHEHRLVEALPRLPDRALYDKLAALNVVDAVRAVTADFYARLGIDPGAAPVMRILTRTRQDLFGDVDPERARHQGSVLVRFEAAWNLFQAGRTAPALETFRALLSDDALWRRARRNVYFREALVRSGEIVGRDAELSGDLETALNLYQRLVTVAGRGVIARRVALLLWRQGRIREAALWAERAIWSDHNLASQAVKHNAHLGRVTEILAKAGAESERGPD